jgi:hypothetical protein
MSIEGHQIKGMTQTHRVNSLRRLLPPIIAALFIAALALPLTAHALTTISQSYATESKLPLGSLVSLEKNTSDRVVASNIANVDSLFGVVINSDSSLLSLSGNQDTQAQVATSGTLQVLVSTINGTISKGDHITASPISGVGMKATGNVRIIGIAQGELTETNGTKQTYKDKDGVEHTVMLGQVPIIVNVAYFFKEPEKTLIPSAIQNVANSLAGKPVKTLPIIVSAAIFIIMLIVVSSITYSMIRSSIISVGRNPLSQSAIYRDLIQLSGIVLVILAVGLISIYLVLTRL